MVGWHIDTHINEYEFEQTPGDEVGQRSLAYFSSWGRKESDMTEQQDTATTGYVERLKCFIHSLLEQRLSC